MLHKNLVLVIGMQLNDMKIRDLILVPLKYVNFNEHLH
jgi:hypothetical protein